MKNRFHFHRFDPLANVAVSPGIGFGKSGEGFVRFSLVENEQRIRQAVRNIRRMLGRRSGIAAAETSAAEAL